MWQTQISLYLYIMKIYGIILVYFTYRFYDNRSVRSQKKAIWLCSYEAETAHSVHSNVYRRPVSPDTLGHRDWWNAWKYDVYNAVQTIDR